MEKEQWIKIQEAEVTDDIQQVHCDTRDFCAIFSSVKYDEIEMATRPWWKVRNDSRFLVAQTDVIQFLCHLEDISGGEGEWRMMSFTHLDYKIGWFKYVRLYRVSPTHFIVTNGTFAVNVNNLTKDNLDKENLCFH